MKIVQLPPGGGKTTEMLVWLLEGHSKGVDRALIVTTQQKRVELHKKLLEAYNANGQPQYIRNAANRIYTVGTVQRKLRGTPHLDKCEIGIDDADEALRFLLGIYQQPSIMSVTDATPVTDPVQKSPIF